jgi:phage terminase small subunit
MPMVAYGVLRGITACERIGAFHLSYMKNTNTIEHALQLPAELPELDPAEFMFCLQYLKHMGNATEAVIGAGLVPAEDRDAGVKLGYELRKKPNIRKAIRKLIEQIFEKDLEMRIAIVRPFVGIVLFDEADIYEAGTSKIRPPSEWPIACRLAFNGFDDAIDNKIQVTWGDRQNAIQILAKILGIASGTDLKDSGLQDVHRLLDEFEKKRGCQ